MAPGSQKHFPHSSRVALCALQSTLPFLALRVDIGTVVDEDFANIRQTGARCEEERRVAVSISGVHVGTLFQQKAYLGGTTVVHIAAIAAEVQRSIRVRLLAHGLELNRVDWGDANQSIGLRASNPLRACI